MTEEMMSLDEVAKECKEAAEYLASWTAFWGRIGSSSSRANR